MTYLYSHLMQARIEESHSLETRSWGEVHVSQISPPLAPGEKGAVTIQFRSGRKTTFDASSLQCEWRGFAQPEVVKGPMKLFAVSTIILVEAEDQSEALDIISEIQPIIEHHESVVRLQYSGALALNITKEQYEHD